MKTLKAGDVLMVWKLDRLGWSLWDLITLPDELKGQGVKFKSLTDRYRSSSVLSFAFTRTASAQTADNLTDGSGGCLRLNHRYKLVTASPQVALTIRESTLIAMSGRQALVL